MYDRIIKSVIQDILKVNDFVSDFFKIKELSKFKWKNLFKQYLHDNINEIHDSIVKNDRKSIEACDIKWKHRTHVHVN